ncbi:FecR domain-containing protein [Parabacteroides sp. AD58]|uniref:FecR domain-containing protein n=1 Tax=Parabacteroides absconsus TaxID=2951805 RepID=A0ABZ2INR4_9BACT|nr:FecR domain-containing protein [Parabacteroides sp. AD58]MCM6902687.1 FecR domain-containing protein [Parabacteroides sp. AD58]
MNDEEKNMYSDEDLRLLQVLGEAAGEQPSAEETEKVWQQFRQQHRQRQNNRYIWASVAAAVVCLLVLGLPFVGERTNERPIELYAALDVPSETTTVEAGDSIVLSTPPEQTAEVRLSDGTRIVLGANSRLAYPRSFALDAPREVRLSGEARFEVAHDANHPFWVISGEMRTEVLGTVFDVNAYPGSRARVILYEGHVRIGHQQEQLDIHPGQQAVLQDNRHLNITSVNLKQAGSWTEGLFDYDNMPLGEVMKHIGTWYNVSITAQSESFLERRIHFRFPRTASLNEVVTALNDLGVARITFHHQTLQVEKP